MFATEGYNLMKNLTEFLKIISDETRMRILVLLLKKELCVCELCEVLRESQPKVSRHLAKLRSVGLVIDERQEQWVFYYENIEEGFKEIMNSIIERIEEYPKLKKDAEKLAEKISDDCLCTRIKK